jgi:hypothetical protein
MPRPLRVNNSIRNLCSSNLMCRLSAGCATRSRSDASAVMQKYFTEGNKDDFYNLYAYTVASTLVKVLEQCGSNVTRENIMAQAANLKDVVLPTLLPGIHVNTSPTNYRPLTQVQLQKWEGKAWARFGEVLGAQSRWPPARHRLDQVQIDEKPAPHRWASSSRHVDGAGG